MPTLPYACGLPFSVACLPVCRLLSVVGRRLSIIFVVSRACRARFSRVFLIFAITATFREIADLGFRRIFRLVLGRLLLRFLCRARRGLWRSRDPARALDEVEEFRLLTTRTLERRRRRTRFNFLELRFRFILIYMALKLESSFTALMRQSVPRGAGCPKWAGCLRGVLWWPRRGAVEQWRRVPVRVAAERAARHQCRTRAS